MEGLQQWAASIAGRILAWDIPGPVLVVLWGFFAYKVWKSGWIQTAWAESAKYVRDIVWEAGPN